MAKEPDPFPSWSKLAIRGDLIRAIVYIRGVEARMRKALIALSNGNKEQFYEAMNEYDEAWRALDGVLKDISES